MRDRWPGAVEVASGSLFVRLVGGWLHFRSAASGVMYSERVGLMPSKAFGPIRVTWVRRR